MKCYFGVCLLYIKTTNRNFLGMSLLIRMIFCLFIARQIMPIVSVVTPTSILIAIWVIMAVCLLKYSLIKKTINRERYFALFLFITMLNIIPFSADLKLFGMRVYEHINMAILPSLTVLYIINNKDFKLCKSLCVCLYLSFLITTITTITGNMVFPHASRMMATGMADNPELLYQYYRYNIGGFDFVYSVALLIPIMIYVIKNNREYRYPLLVLVFTSIYSIYVSEYTTALLISLLGLSCFFMSSVITRRHLKLYFIVIAVFALFFYTVIPVILNAVADMLGSDDIAVRLHDISDMILGKELDKGSDIATRQNIYMDSFMGFLENPIVGIQENRGGHSFVLGVLCYWGMFGFLMLYFLLRNLNKIFFKPFVNTSINGHICVFYALYLIVITLNPRVYLIVPLFCIPLVAYYLESKRFVVDTIKV